MATKSHSRANTPLNIDRDAFVPQWLWLWLPIILYFGHFVVRILVSDEFIDRYMLHETGFTEHATIVVTVMALILGLLVVKRLWHSGWVLRLFFIVFCLGCFYFAGEEASWGQHWGGWGTPDTWSHLNDQDETNLHNLGGVARPIFDQWPRLLLGLAAFFGGAILPLVRRARGQHHAIGSQAYWIMPGLACVPVGLIASLATIPDKINKALTGELHWILDIHLGEVKELMIGTFLMIYISTVWIRLRHTPDS